ncbi:MAG: MFS transporter [Fusobacteria bacterium]|nr:MFS transporter [Fusobacteriota bacterium]
MKTEVVQAKSNYLIFLLLMILLISGMATDIYIPSLPEITTQFHTTESLASITISIFVLTSALSGLFAPMLSDRFGRKPVLLYTNIAFAIATLILIFSNDINTMIIIRAVQGITVGFNFIVTRQIVKDLYTPKEQVSLNSLLFTAFVISPAIAPIVGAFIATHLSWRYCFLVLLLFIFYLIWAISKSLSESIPVRKDIPNIINYSSSFFFFLLTKEFNAYLIITSCCFAPYFIFLNISSYIFIENFKFTPLLYSYIFIFLSLLYLIGNWLMRRLNNRDYPHYKIVTIGVLCNLFGSILMGLALILPGLELKAFIVIISAILMRFGLGFMLALVQIIAMNRFKKNSGQALGFLVFIQMIIASIGSMWASTFSENLLLGMFITSVFFNIIAYIALQLLLRFHIHFPNVKKKIFKKILLSDRWEKYFT